MIRFNETVLLALAYSAGWGFSVAQNISGNKFFGGFNVADAIGFERGGLEWRAAVSGAMAHIDTLEVVTDKDGRLIA